MTNIKSNAIVLCGGNSLRMGFDKYRLEINGQNLLKGSIEELLNIFDQVTLVAKEGMDLSEFLGSRVVLVQDEYSAGPLGGLHAGLKAAPCDSNFLIACDMPLSWLNYLKALKTLDERHQKYHGVVHVNPTTGLIEPFFGFYHKSLIPEIEASILKGNFSLRKFIASTNFLEISMEVAMAKDLFFNINRPKDLLALRREVKDREIDAKDLRIKEVPITRYKGSEGKDLQDEVIVEASLRVFVNGFDLITMQCSPSDLEELVLGHLFTQGMIQTPSDVNELSIRQVTDPSKGELVFEAHVYLKEGLDIKATKPLMTSTGLTTESLDSFEVRSNQAITLDLAHISRVAAKFQETSDLFVRTGGNHAVALVQNKEILCFREDIGRHNALDKVIGWGLSETIDFSRCMVLLSGRMAKEMTKKVLKTSIPVLLSRSAPTDETLRLAKTYNLSLIGFIRSDRMNIYHLNSSHELIKPAN